MKGLTRKCPENGPPTERNRRRFLARYEIHQISRAGLYARQPALRVPDSSCHWRPLSLTPMWACALKPMRTNLGNPSVAPRWAVTVLLCTVLGRVVAVAKAQVLPAPTGSYGVGRIILHWQDPSRPEVLSSASNARRQLVVWIWYPATAKGPSAPYIDQLEALAGALPRADVAKARSVQTHAVANAMPSAAPAL